MCDGVTNWPPYIDKSNSGFEEAWCLFSEVTVYSGHAGVEGLVNVDAFLCVDSQFSDLESE